MARWRLYWEWADALLVGNQCSYRDGSLWWPHSDLGGRGLLLVWLLVLSGAVKMQTAVFLHGQISCQEEGAEAHTMVDYWPVILQDPWGNLCHTEWFEWHLLSGIQTAKYPPASTFRDDCHAACGLLLLVVLCGGTPGHESCPIDWQGKSLMELLIYSLVHTLHCGFYCCHHTTS